MAFMASMALGLTACATSTESKWVTSESSVRSGDIQRAMQGARTVALHPRARVVRPLSGDFEFDIREAIEGAIARTLRSAGYEFVSPQQADRLIAYAIGATGTMADAELVQIFGISSGVDTTSGATRGGVVLAIAHPGTGAVLYRTSGSAAITGKPSRDASTKAAEVRRAIEKLFEPLPAASRD